MKLLDGAHIFLGIAIGMWLMLGIMVFGWLMA